MDDLDRLVGTTQMMIADDGFEWQVGVWDRMADVYPGEIDPRFVEVLDFLFRFASLEPGERVLDLGTGTGAVARLAAAAVGTGGAVVGVDISPRMLEIARAKPRGAGLAAIDFREGRAEAIPAENDAFDAVLASLSLMYVIDRGAAAREIARVLAPGGRLVAAVWAGADENDIVRFQETAGRFAPTPPVSGVGPGALADPSPFVAQLESAGFEARHEKRVTKFVFEDLESAWEPLAGVTSAGLEQATRQAAKNAVQKTMWPEPASPRWFQNTTHYIIARKAR